MSYLAQDLVPMISVNVNDDEDYEKNLQGDHLGRRCSASLGILQSWPLGRQQVPNKSDLSRLMCNSRSPVSFF